MSIFKFLFGNKERENSYSKNESILLLEGMLKYENNEIEESINIFTKGVNNYPNNPFFFYMRGNAKEDFSQYDEAIEDFKKFLKLKPNTYNALFRIGLCYQNQKKYSDALPYYDLAERHFVYVNSVTEEFEKLINSESKSDYYNIKEEKIYSNRSIIKANLGDSESCINDCTKAININPSYPHPYFIRGLEYLKNNKLKLAENDIKEADSLGYPQAKSILEKYFTESKKDELDVFLDQITQFSESEDAINMTGGIKMRNGFKDDLRSNLNKYGNIQIISAEIILNESIEYNLDMWKSFLNQNGNLEDFQKGHIAYEISKAIEYLRPDIDTRKLLKSVMLKSLNEI